MNEEHEEKVMQRATENNTIAYIFIEYHELLEEWMASDLSPSQTEVYHKTIKSLSDSEEFLNNF